jgi:hypothetical protein
VVTTFCICTRMSNRAMHGPNWTTIRHHSRVSRRDKSGPPRYRRLRDSGGISNICHNDVPMAQLAFRCRSGTQKPKLRF